MTQDIDALVLRVADAREMSRAATEVALQAANARDKAHVIMREAEHALDRELDSRIKEVIGRDAG